MKKGILLLSLGEPESPEGVAGYLGRLRADPVFLADESGLVQRLFRGMRARSLAASLAKGYGEMALRTGTPSPQRHWAIQQEKGLGTALGEGYRVRVGFHFGSASIESALANLREWGAEELVLFSLSPQFSQVGAGYCFRQAHSVLQDWGWRPSIREILHWPDHAAYVQLTRERIATALGDENAHVLFTAGSFPQKQGDMYATDLARSVASIVRGLGLPWSIGFHSAISRSPKLMPNLEDELRRLSLGELKKILFVPLNFTSDHYELLQELDVRYAGLAKSLGFASVSRIEPFNGDPKFVRVLREVLVGNGVVPAATREAGR